MIDPLTAPMLAVVSSLVIPYGPGPQQAGDLLLPSNLSEDTPKLLLIHGGGWRSDKYLRGTLSDEAKLFCEAGYAVYNIDYRLAPEAAWPAIGDDCLAAARKFVSCNGMPELSATKGQPIAILGASAGGHLALMTGLRLPRVSFPVGSGAQRRRDGRVLLRRSGTGGAGPRPGNGRPARHGSG